MIDHRSYKQCSCQIKPEKKFRPEWLSNPWPLRYWCGALPTELYVSSQLRAGRAWIFFFQALISQPLKLCITAMINYVYIYIFSAVQNMIFHISTCILHHLRVYYTLTVWPALSWLDTYSSVGRAPHQYRRGHGFESHSGLNFFSGLIWQLLKFCI